MNLNIAFEPNLLGVMSQFSQFTPTLEKYLATATEQAGGKIAEYGIDNMHWKEPTGALEGSIAVVLQDAYNAQIGSDLPYALRREFGFSGTDAIGRVIKNDPGAFFMTLAIEDPSLLQEVSEIYIDAVLAAWNECCGKIPPGTSASISI